MHHGQVAVDAHQADEEDPAVKRNVENAQDHFAHGIPKHPLIQGLVGQKGECAHQEEIRESQVKEAHVGHAAESRAKHNDPDDQQVSQEAEEEEKGVEGRKKHGSMTLVHTHPKVRIVIVIEVFRGV